VPSDLQHDSIGRGADEAGDSLKRRDAAVKEAIANTSTGYVRNNLYVLKNSENEEVPEYLKDFEETKMQASGGGGETSIPSGGLSTQGGSVNELRQMAKIKGYEGDACTECGNFTLVRNGTCMKCDTCGSTSGCS